MNKRYLIAFSWILLLLAYRVNAQQVLVNDVKKRELDNISVQSNNAFITSFQKALSLAPDRGWAISRQTPNGGLVSLQGINSLGFPIYLGTHNNTTAAATTGTNQVQPGGSLGLNLSGSSASLNNKIAIWDGGWVFRTHQEFTGKTITLKDTSSVIDHATHVAGTMMAKGVYGPAKGMAFNANTLLSYDFNNDVAEMSRAASGLLLSNHSYGEIAGWDFNSSANRWEWYGLPGDSVDYNFGIYTSRTQSWDNIAYNAPYYLIVESAGNNRASNGPAVGATYYGYASRTNQTIVNKGPRPAGISNNGGYDIITVTANAKNILTVGAINPLPFGPANRSDLSIADFSSWGPTDDGRIKPDIVGDGVNVLSSSSSGTAAYSALSGTSFSAPNVTGSLYLLQEYYAQKNAGNFMRAATLKGLACHTAFDGGNVGPDYIYGWGLLDMRKAAQAITDNGTKSQLKENTLAQGQQQTFTAVASGNGPLIATISWTDLAGTATPDGIVNSRTPKLVNDLDIRVSDGTTTFKPWVLDPLHPSAAAITGDNVLDNIEQVYIANAVPGKTYTITVSHKGTLQSGPQAYSLIITGAGGAAYCTSAPTSNADSRIGGMSLSNINNFPPAGCTSYSDYTNLTIQLEQGRTYPLNLTLGTCGGDFNKAAKVYIDWNSNGIFEAGELVATTGIINGTGAIPLIITVPSTVIPGNYSLMRVVLNETSDASTIQACGSYAKGETQDYKVQFAQVSTDAGITAIVSPQATGSCNGSTAVTVTIKNFGRQTLTNIPVTVTVKAPDNSITTISETYTGKVTSQAQTTFTLNGTFNALPGATYVITATTNLVTDPIATNDQTSQSVAIVTPTTATNLSAFYCNDGDQYLLSGAGDGQVLWYKNINDALPFTYGSGILTTQAPISNTYYAGLNDFSGTAGPATKNVYPGGGYNQFTPSVLVSTAIPVIIQSARLYIGNSGSITFNVADVNGQIVSSSTINAVATRANPQPGAQADDPTDVGKVYNLNLLLPGSGKYTITAVFDSTATLYRNNAGISGYPFRIGNIFSITGNNATPPVGTDTTYYKNFYYFFYNMQVKSAGCTSGVRQAVTVTKPTITQTGATLGSNIATGNQWYLAGKAIAGATGQSYTPTQSGIYQLKITLSTGCISESDTYVYVLTTNNAGNNATIGLVTYPVPTNKQLNVIFGVQANSQLNLSLVNSAGKIVYSNTQALAAGNFSTVLNVADQAPGTYVLKILLGQNQYTQKIMIVR